MADPNLPNPKARGSRLNPPNRFDRLHYAPTEDAEPEEDSPRSPLTVFLTDHARSIVTENDSPDIPFRYSLNPYRGCEHGCAYCYARPSHEYLGYNAGLDFETKILVKEEAPELFREFLCRDGWVPEPVVLSGVTDPYQPAERHFRVTCGCLEVAVEARQPMSLITKNALILRDLDLLRDLAAADLVHVNISVTTLDAALARALEPRTSTPAARLRAVERLSGAGVPVRVLVAPIIPALNDSEIPAILAAASQAGARTAGYQMLRLPGAVLPVFQEWLGRKGPALLQRVEGRIRAVRGGKLNDANFGTRMTGTGELARQIKEMFRLFVRRHGLDGGLPPYNCTAFRRPRSASGQGWLF